MRYRSLTILADNCEKDLKMIVNEDCVIFKYLCDNEPTEDIINYEDIDALFLGKSEYGYSLGIESNNITFELLIELDDIDKRKKCEILYGKVLPIMRKKHDEESLDIKFNKDDQGRLTNFCIKEKSSNNKFKEFIPYIIFIIALLLATKI